MKYVFANRIVNNWNVLPDSCRNARVRTTSHQSFVVCTGCPWSSELTISWRPSCTRRCVVRLHRTWSTTASRSPTPDAASSARLMPTCSVFRGHSRLGDRSFSVAGQRVWNSLPASLRQPDVEFGQFKRLLKSFLFGEIAAHLWLFCFQCAVYKSIYLLTYLLKLRRSSITVSDVQCSDIYVNSFVIIRRNAKACNSTGNRCH